MRYPGSVRAASLLSVCFSWACAATPTNVKSEHPTPATARPNPAEAHCPAAASERLRTLDLRSADASGFFGTIAAETVECQVAALRGMAGRLDATSHHLVLGDFCSTAATLARFLDAEARSDVSAAYLRFPYVESIHSNYFLGLRANHIDLRSHLAGKITEDWSFTSPRRDGETWQYYLYLASLGDPGAYTRLADKIATTRNGNDATNFLASLAELETPAAKQILLKYADDPRRADGPDGPAAPISTTVARLLERHFSR